MVQGSRPKKTKRSDKRPARPRYWSRGRLKVNKIKRLVKCNGLTVEQALKQWEATRKRHRDKLANASGVYKEIEKLKRYER